MPDTITPNIQFVKPEVTGSIDTWGGKTNTNWDKADTAIKENQDKANNSIKKTSLDEAERTATELLFYSEGFTVPDTELDALVSSRFLRSVVNRLFPIGMVMMWAGAVEDIPDGWALCNGQYVGAVGTPNLSERFVIAAGTSVPPGAFGGNQTLNLATKTSGTGLTAAQNGPHFHNIADNGHVHNTRYTNITDDYGAQAGSAYYRGRLAQYVSDGVETSAAGTGITKTGDSGTGQTHDHNVGFNLTFEQHYPLFYALCYIMKVVDI